MGSRWYHLDDQGEWITERLRRCLGSHDFPCIKLHDRVALVVNRFLVISCSLSKLELHSRQCLKLTDQSHSFTSHPSI